MSTELALIALNKRIGQARDRVAYPASTDSRWTIQLLDYLADEAQAALAELRRIEGLIVLAPGPNVPGSHGETDESGRMVWSKAQRCVGYERAHHAATTTENGLCPECTARLAAEVTA